MLIAQDLAYFRSCWELKWYNIRELKKLLRYDGHNGDLACRWSGWWGHDRKGNWEKQNLLTESNLYIVAGRPISSPRLFQWLEIRIGTSDSCFFNVIAL